MASCREYLSSNLRPEAWFDLQFAFVPKLVAHQRRGLSGTLQGAGDNGINLDVHGGQRAPDVTTLFNAFLVESSFFVLFRVGDALTRAGVAQEVDNHRGLGFLSRASDAADCRRQDWNSA